MCIYACFIILVASFLPPVLGAAERGLRPQAPPAEDCRDILAPFDFDRLQPLLSRFWHANQFVANLPGVFSAARDVGLTDLQTTDVLAVMLESNKFDFSDVGKMADNLALALREAKVAGLHFENQTENLKDAVRRPSGERLLGVLPLAFRYGWQPAQIANLSEKLDTQGRVDDFMYGALKMLLRTLIAYDVDRKLSFEFLSKLFDRQYVEGVLEDLPLYIEIGVLLRNVSSDAVLNEIGAIVDKAPVQFEFSLAHTIAKAMSAPSPAKDMIGDGSSPNIERDFPLLNGPLRHSLYPYRVHATYYSGLSDLRELCLASGERREGAFVFDQTSQTWFSFGGVTEVLIHESRAHTVFQKFDFAAFGSQLIFVHIHPKSLEYLMRIDRDTLAEPKLEKQLSTFAAIIPSRADIETLVEFRTKASKPIDLRAVIVHSLGETVVTLLGENDPAIDVAEAAKLYGSARDAMFLDPGFSVQEMQKMTDKPPLVFYFALLERLNQRLGGRFRVQLVPTTSLLEQQTRLIRPQ